VLKPSVEKKYQKKMKRWIGSKALKSLMKYHSKQKAVKKPSAAAACETAAAEAAAAAAKASAEAAATPGAAAHGSADAAVLPPLPPPAEELEEEPVAEPAPSVETEPASIAGLKFGDHVRIWSDRYGKAAMGADGNIVKIDHELKKVTIETFKLKKFEVAADHVELCDALKGCRPPKNLRQVTGDHRLQWLGDCGWADELRTAEDSFETLRAPLQTDEPFCVSAEQVQLYLKYLHWSLEVGEECRWVDPVLLWSFCENEDPDLEAAKLKWRCILKEFKNDAAICLPICHAEHWTLLAISMKTKVCRYYDSLAHGESEACYLRADYLVQKLRAEETLSWLPPVLEHKTNSCSQAFLQCGFFVLWWCEEEWRERLGQGRWRRAWPNVGQVKDRMLKLFLNLEPAAKRLQTQLKELQEAEEKAGAASESAAGKAAAEAAAAVKAAAGAMLHAGEKGEAVDLKIEPVGNDVEHWAEQVMELMLPAHVADVKRVRSEGAGICSSCRWSSGCHRCLWWKTVRYWRNKECKGAFMEGYSETTKAAVKSKAKAKSKMKPGKLKGGGDLQVFVCSNNKALTS
jgi:hypothetical protein